MCQYVLTVPLWPHTATWAWWGIYLIGAKGNTMAWKYLSSSFTIFVRTVLILKCNFLFMYQCSYIVLQKMSSYCISFSFAMLSETSVMILSSYLPWLTFIFTLSLHHYWQQLPEYICLFQYLYLVGIKMQNKHIHNPVSLVYWFPIIKVNDTW